MTFLRVTRHASRLTAVLLSCTALGLVFWGLLQIDLPLARFLRSVHVEWLEQAGNVGNRAGSGAVLVAVSGAMVVAGWLLKRSALYRAGFESVLAHGAAALIVQVLKHLIGRPRPRMMHNGGFQFGPSLETGLDSFPSGHAAASFAVATVLAKHFPGLAWPLYGAAAVVAVSRIVRGSHFPTDVAAGLVLGVLVGAVVANPLRQWRKSLVQALSSLVPFLIIAVALLWAMAHVPPEEGMNRLLLGSGLAAVGIGVSERVAWRLGGRLKGLDLRAANVLLCLGVALTTGSLFVSFLALLGTIAWWMAPADDVQPPGSEPATEPAPTCEMASVRRSPTGSREWMQRFMAEIAIAALVAIAIVAIQALKGILPLL
jgi:undecaprenyl-diphosphatase